MYRWPSVLEQLQNPPPMARRSETAAASSAAPWSRQPRGVRKPRRSLRSKRSRHIRGTPACGPCPVTSLICLPFGGIGGVSGPSRSVLATADPLDLHRIRCLGHLRHYPVRQGLTRLFLEGRWRVTESRGSGGPARSARSFGSRPTPLGQRRRSPLRSLKLCRSAQIDALKMRPCTAWTGSGPTYGTPQGESSPLR
jgi:hypothetical protein